MPASSRSGVATTSFPQTGHAFIDQPEYHPVCKICGNVSVFARLLLPGVYYLYMYNTLLRSFSLIVPVAKAHERSPASGPVCFCP